MGRLYRRLFEKRQESDYTDLVKFDAGDVKNMLQESVSFVNIISEKTEEKITGEL